MRGRPIHPERRRKHLWPVLLLAYALLVQSILGPAAAGAYAFAMAQHEALGLTMLCADGSGTPNEPAPRDHAPESDCLTCKIACTASFGVAALPVPETDPIHVVADFGRSASPLPTDEPVPAPTRHKSDLASRAPPAALI